MSPEERVALMKQVWSQWRNTALKRFQQNPTDTHFIASLRTSVSNYPLSDKELNTPVETFTFVREILRNYQIGDKFWRITCDGIEVEVWQFK